MFGQSFYRAFEEKKKKEKLFHLPKITFDTSKVPISFINIGQTIISIN